MRISHLALLGLSLFACRGGGMKMGDDDNTPDTPVQGGAVTIQMIQDPAMPKGTQVEVDNVIVTAIDTFGTRTGDLWVEEPGGGEFSGVKVFGAPLDQVAMLAVGDTVTITNAEKDEFAIMTDTSGRTVTELKGAGGGMLTITKTGTGTLPTPGMVDAAMIDMLPDQASKDAEWQKWEGVLVTVTNVRQSGNVAPFGGGGVDQTQFDTLGRLEVESSLSDIGTNTAGTCYASITGIGDYAFNYLLLPRSTADLVAGGTGCTAKTIATIPQVQAGTATGFVEVDNVFVTAIAHDKKAFWVSQNLTAAATEGVFIFNKQTLDPGVVVGAKVSLLGTTQEFNDDTAGGTLTEITNPAVTVQAGTPGTVVPVAGKTAVQLKDANTGPMFESVLVTLTNVNIMMAGDATNGFIATAVQNGTTFGAATTILQTSGNPPQMATGCYTTITGFWTNLEATGSMVTTHPNAFGFIPATLGPTGAGCN